MFWNIGSLIIIIITIQIILGFFFYLYIIFHYQIIYFLIHLQFFKILISVETQHLLGKIHPNRNFFYCIVRSDSINCLKLFEVIVRATCIAVRRTSTPISLTTYLRAELVEGVRLGEWYCFRSPILLRSMINHLC